jgi:hypothetical protein
LPGSIIPNVIGSPSSFASTIATAVRGAGPTISTVTLVDDGVPSVFFVGALPSVFVYVTERTRGSSRSGSFSSIASSSAMRLSPSTSTPAATPLGSVTTTRPGAIIFTFGRIARLFASLNFHFLLTSGASYAGPFVGLA